jgi:hypothetical protein
MKIFLSILRELGILILIVLVLLAATFFAFKEQVPYAKEIPVGDEYAVANRKEYSVLDTLYKYLQIYMTTEYDFIKRFNVLDEDIKIRVLSKV